jgi:hypothetical protein
VRTERERRSLLRFSNREVVAALGFAGLVNLAMVMMSASAFSKSAPGLSDIACRAVLQHHDGDDPQPGGAQLRPAAADDRARRVVRTQVHHGRICATQLAARVAAAATIAIVLLNILLIRNLLS